MNLFRLVGDMAHLASFLVLLLKLLASRSANGAWLAPLPPLSPVLSCIPSLSSFHWQQSTGAN